MCSSGATLKKFQIPWEEISKATNDFSEENLRGEGGFSKVYKGQLSQDWGNRTVAIKCLKVEDKTEFREELDKISSLRHHNIISFIGYSDDGEKMSIVTEYAVKGSLDSHLVNLGKRAQITWAQRLKICLGVAQGLKHLHLGHKDNNRIIHRDLKSANILLDDKMEAKICDFGLSKFGPINQSHTTIFTGLAGTECYIDPFSRESGAYSKKSDIYSFGVVMFEILSGMMAYDVRSDADGKEANLMSLVRRDYKLSLKDLKDPNVKGDIDDDAFHLFKNIALKCVDSDKKKRPTADTIIHDIQKALNIQEKKDRSATGTPQPEMSEADKRIVHILELDPRLGPYKDHLEYRIKRFYEWKRLFDLYEEGLEEFAKGYLKFGFNRKEGSGSVVYREWAPAAEKAQLVGMFNRCDGSNHEMEKDQFGVWTIKIPDNENGDSAIPHNSVVKFRFKHKDGDWIERVPAWTKSTTSAPPYDGVYWDPPAIERHIREEANRPSKPEAPHIYRAHVGLRSSEPRVKSYREFADNILPRIQANKYNTIQLMAVMEHSDTKLFSYHVRNFFAVSSSSGTPEDLKYLIDKAHRLGLRVLMDVVHSHVEINDEHGLTGFDVGQATEISYFHTGERGYHTLWDSKLFNYGNWEVLRFLLSNLMWWLDEFKFDGFCFQGVTSMLYHHHGINFAFTGDYKEYFSERTDLDSIVYLMLANDLIHSILPDATVIAEDVSGMPGLGIPLDEGGIGFDFI